MTKEFKEDVLYAGHIVYSLEAVNTIEEEGVDYEPIRYAGYQIERIIPELDESILLPETTRLIGRLEEALDLNIHCILNPFSDRRDALSDFFLEMHGTGISPRDHDWKGWNELHGIVSGDPDVNLHSLIPYVDPYPFRELAYNHLLPTLKTHDG